MDRLPNEILGQICLYLQGPPHGPRRDLSSLSRVNCVCYKVAAPILYRNLTLKFWDMQSLQSAVSEVTENPQGHHFMKYVRRLYIVCLNKGSGRGEEEAFQWKLEPWAVNLRADRAPAARNSFLDYWLTSCNPCPGKSVVINNAGGLYWERSWTPVVSLIAYLDHLEQLDFITDNEFTSDLEQAISHHHPNCRVNITWRQAVGYSVLNTEARKQLCRHEIWSKYEFDINVLQLPGLYTLAVNLIHSESRSAVHEDLDEMLPFLVNAPGSKHLDLQGQIDNLGFPLARTKGKMARLDRCSPTYTNISTRIDYDLWCRAT